MCSIGLNVLRLSIDYCKIKWINEGKAGLQRWRLFILTAQRHFQAWFRCSLLQSAVVLASEALAWCQTLVQDNMKIACLYWSLALWRESWGHTEAENIGHSVNLELGNNNINDFQWRKSPMSVSVWRKWFLPASGGNFLLQPWERI